MRLSPLLLPVLCACTPGVLSRTLPQPGGAGGDDSVDSQGQPTVEVSHPRELRGVWVATVWNINFPDADGAAAQQAELEDLAELVADLGMNAIFFQVRPEGDALYSSEIEPWSRYLTGTQGQDPGYDPLETLIEAAHARGVEVHAWLNPYRGGASRTAPLASTHLCAEHPQSCVDYGSLLWMDPGDAAVRANTLAVVSDLAQRYDLDGVHFDDYFYPYPDGTEFPDDRSWAAYGAAGGTLARDAWRRDNVNTLLFAVSSALRALRPELRFGVAPFGIYRPGIPEGTTGFDPYAGLYADALLWIQEGWLDYCAPQLYWPSTQTAQAYGTLMGWWAAQPTQGQHTFGGNALYQLGSSSAWTLEELAEQVALTRAHADQGALGNIWYHVGPLEEDTLGVVGLFRDTLYATPAAPPPVPAVADEPPAPPVLTAEDGGVGVSSAAPARWWAVYAAEGEGWALRRLLPGGESHLSLEPGVWAVSAIAPGGAESRAVVVER